MAVKFEHETTDAREPCYVIGVVSGMVGVHPQTLRHYERIGLVRPFRSRGNTRLYSRQDVEQLRRIKSLVDSLGINLAGVQMVLRLSEQMSEMERTIRELQAEVERLAEKRGRT